MAGSKTIADLMELVRAIEYEERLTVKGHMGCFSAKVIRNMPLNVLEPMIEQGKVGRIVGSGQRWVLARLSQR